jgi:hypothetical protein
MAVNLPAGPEAWRHWLALKEGLPRGAAWEFVLYTDAWLTGGPEFQAGPFQIFNTVPARIPAEMAPAVVVRADSYLPPPEIPAMGQTNVETWLGLSLDDEIAVLLSLALGARLRGGGLIREFEQDADPRGRPVEYLHRPPTWTPPSGNQFMLPGLLGGHRSLDEAVSHLNRLPATPAPAAVALVRGARQYRDALWLGDSDPHLAWLLLVSAVESCARHLAHLPGPTSKFVEFIVRFAPGPPDLRPEFSRVDWTELRKAVKTVYGHRSAALHEGTPMPAPLCQPPHLLQDGLTSERPPGLGSAAGASTWKPKDLPMHLHIFAHIVRGALLAWWHEVSDAGTP